MPLTRREFLSTSGAAAVAGATVSALAGAATAHRTDSLPEHVTIDYDATWLKRYQPRTYLATQDRPKYLGTYAWRATSPEYDTDVGVYWMSYSHQEGVTSYDSHFGDHEPCYCFVDSETGDLQTVVGSIYHWIAGKVPAASVPTTNDGDAPRLRVISPWHQYTAAGESTAVTRRSLSSFGTGDELRDDDTQTEFETWLDNGLDESLAPGTAVEPWTMLTRESWWRRGAFDFSWTETLVEIRRSLGLGVEGSLEGTG